MEQKPRITKVAALLNEARTKRDYAGRRDMLLFWSVANEQMNTLHDPAGARHTLREAESLCESVADVLMVASARRCHFGVDQGFGALLSAAKARATVALGWVESGWRSPRIRTTGCVRWRDAREKRGPMAPAHSETAGGGPRMLRDGR